MAIIETKYSVGDTVYYAGTVTERRQHPCPDCKGTKKWAARSPAGGEYTFACPRCTASYISERDLMLDYAAYVPSVCKRTIGSVQFNSAPGSHDSGARYMCVETGVGSGQVYEENRLFESEDEALIAAQALADASNTSTGWVAKQYDKSLRVSDYQLENAALKAAKDAASNARSMLYNLGDLFGRIKDAADKDEILEAVDDYKTYDWSRDKERIESLQPKKEDAA